MFRTETPEQFNRRMYEEFIEYQRKRKGETAMTETGLPKGQTIGQSPLSHETAIKAISGGIPARPVPMTTPTRKVQNTMTFGNATECLLGLDVSIRRLEWPDQQSRLAMVNGQLCVFVSDTGMFHPALISSTDIEAMDWVVEDV